MVFLKMPLIKTKIPININKIDIKRIVLFDKKSSSNKDSFKYFIRYMHKCNGFPATLCMNFLK